MGITGLLPFLKKIHQPVNVSKFEGCTIAIDAYCWLHKGAFSCAEKLALGEKTDQYVNYCMKFLNTLLAKNIKPIMVFDGCHLPSKKGVETSRREKREMNRKKAAQFLREGRRAEARECLQRCIDISPEMALEVMNVCRSKGIDCIVAPYEADAQLAYLDKIGVAQVIITEDSDLLLFGCNQVLFKMDHSGNGILIEKCRLNEVMALQTSHYTFEKFRYMCILSGCDYLPSLSGIGLAKANKAFKLAREADLKQFLNKLSSYLKLNMKVPQEYKDGFIQANNTFLYQLVFNPLQRQLVPLTPYPSDIKHEDIVYAGPYIKPDRAYQLALGNINIYSNEKFANYNPDTYVPKCLKRKPESPHSLSIWDRNYKIGPRTGMAERHSSERPTVKGKEVSVMPVLKRASPKKRLREGITITDSEEVKSNKELSSLYVESSTPPSKRCKTESMKTELHRFMVSADQPFEEDVSFVEKEAKDFVNEGPIFLNSLSEAQPEVLDSNKENRVTSPVRNVFAFKSPSKKPKFNLDAKKPAEVKSRFFTKSCKQPKVSQSLQKGPVSTNVSEEASTNIGYKFVHENTANMQSNPTVEKTNTECEKYNVCVLPLTVFKKDENTAQPLDIKSFNFREGKSSDSYPYKPSPSTAFNWSKFKFFSKQKDGNDDHKALYPPSMTTYAINKKKLKTDLGGDKYRNNYENDSDIYTEVCDSDESDASLSSGRSLFESNRQTVENATIQSRYSKSKDCSSEPIFPYSINSSCNSSKPETSLGDIQPQNACKSKMSHIITCLQAHKGQDINLKTINSFNTYETVQDNQMDELGPRREVFISKEDSEMEGSIIEDSQTTVNSPTNRVDSVMLSRQSLRSNKGKTKGGCRVSGLSRKSKLTILTEGGKQQSLKDMFSKFSHSKSCNSKFSHGSDASFTTGTAAGELPHTDEIT